MIPPDVRLYTWLDYEDALIRAIEGEGFPDWLVDARTYWDGSLIRVKKGRKADAQSWLLRNLEPRIGLPADNLFTDLEVILESENGGARRLALSLEETDDQGDKSPPAPTFARPSLVDAGFGQVASPSPLPNNAPPVFAFHSFKGGVGRTLHALALAQTVASRKSRVLLIDADLEAPGITWLLETRLPYPPISFADLLALVHSDPDPAAKQSLKLVASRLQDSLQNGMYVLPAFRSTRMMQLLDIRPEHLLKGSDTPFRLLNLISELGRMLGVVAVVVDLRAGLSELSSGLLLDPRASRVLVTTLSGQSLEGTDLVLSLIAKRAPSRQDDHPTPIVVLNQVPRDLENTDFMTRIEERLFGSLSQTVLGQDVGVLDVLRGPTWFDQSLITLPSGWDDALASVRKCQAYETVRSMIPIGPAILTQPTANTVPGSDLNQARASLATTAERLVFAEQGEDEDFLPISPLRKLVEDHRTQIPVAVVVGAKGAGKTYTYLQILRRREWLRFAQDIPTDIDVNSVVVPLLQPKNLRGNALTICKQGRDEAMNRINLGEGIDHEGVSDRVLSLLRDNLHEGEWRDKWLDLIAWTVGFNVQQVGAGRQLPSELSRRDKRILLVVDGLEDLFQGLATNEAQKVALRSLLQDVPNWLEQQPDRTIGLVVFVRRDMVTLAVPQNSLQLLSRYEQYALKWEREDALRLAAWLAQKVEQNAELDVEQLLSMSEAELAETLAPLWGRKLGSDKSREAKSADWVIAALSDFRSQIQARDLVRLVADAAKHSVVQTQWMDRLLTPTAVRQAVRYCSTQKVEEISQENPALKNIFSKLRDVDAEKRYVPFTREDVDVSKEELALVEANGIVVMEKDKYYLAEIFRHALDYKLPKGARPRVLLLARRRRGTEE
ncbi:MAG: AAA family ATPase [Bryobacteraceae bacterium]